MHDCRWVSVLWEGKGGRGGERGKRSMAIKNEGKGYFSGGPDDRRQTDREH
jgi:hypothetical protein